MARLQIRRSTGSSAPTSLYPGELAFSAGLDSLYIGSPVTGGLLAVTQAAAAGGSGYIAGDVGKVCVVSGGGGSNGSVVIKAVSGGAVTEFYTTPEAMGTGYSATTGAAISDATTTGTGATVTFTISSTTASLPKKLVNSTPETNTSGAKIALAEGTHYGSHEVTLAAPDELDASLTFTLPSADGSAGQFLKTDASGNLSFDTVTQSLTISDGSTTDSVATGETLTFAATANEVTTAVTGNTVTIGLPDDVTIGNDLTVTGDMNVLGAMTTIETSDVAVKDKTMVLGVAGGMEEQTYTQSGTTVTVSSSNHGFSNGEYVYISGSANTADNVYQLTSVADVNTFTFTGSSSATVGSATSIFHSSNKVTKTTGNGSGLVVPIAGGMASIKYEETSDDWGFSENIDLASGKAVKIAGTSVLNATTLGANVENSSLTTVGTIATGVWEGTDVGVAHGGTGASTAAAARTNLGVDAAGTDNSTPVTLANTNYLSLDGQEITGGTVPVTSGGTGSTSAGDARTALGLAIGTNVQAYDADLAAIAGLTSAADKGIQFTGSGTAATYNLTTAGKALLDDADAAAQRTTLGLVIGTNVQAYDADLAAIAGLTSAADKGIQFTGSGTAATYDLTAAGKALLDDADAAAQRTTLGVAIGSDVQAYDAQLADVAGLAVTDGGFIVGNGSNFVLETGATARTSLGLGSLATLNTVSVTTGGTGLTTINKGSVLYSDADDSIAAADGGSVITGAGNTGFLQYSVTGDAVAWTESIDGGTY